MYKTVRPLLFRLDTETSHDLVVNVLARLARRQTTLAVLRGVYANRVPALPVKLMGLELKHPVGLAAGFDKDARAFSSLSALGFSFVETGTVTPRPQLGNPKQRLFRLTQDRALINRMGFNSAGLESFVQRLRSLPRTGLVGVNLGKNAITDLENAISDYLLGLTQCYPYADYIALNISSPNTPTLRQLQDRAHLDGFLAAIEQCRRECAERCGRRVPLAIKIAPDLKDEQLQGIARLVLKHQIDGVIATNTTVQRVDYLKSATAAEPGGLSGAPLRALSNEIIRKLYTYLEGQVPIIGVGGIFTAEDAWQKLIAGADALQIYTSFVFEGPRVVRNIVQGLARKLTTMKTTDLSSAVKTVRSASEHR